MSSEESFIFGDWGSTAMRLALCRIANGEVEEIETARSVGIKFAADPEATFFSVAADWFQRHGAMPVVLAGMVGSNRGWKETAYVECPAAAGDLARAARRFQARGNRLTIVPGLSCTNIFGIPDIMRGEETQIFGWWAHIGRPAGRHLVCLPGTHAKWAIVEDGAVGHFFTSMQGELFDILLKHSLLGTAQTKDVAIAPVQPSDPAFRQGLELIAADPSLSIEHAMFAARSLLVKGMMAETDVPAFLSGLLTAADVRDALRALEHHNETFESLSFVGSPGLIALYAVAAERFDQNASRLDAGQAMRTAAGLFAQAMLAPQPTRTNP